MIEFYVYEVGTLNIVYSGQRSDGDESQVVCPDGCAVFVAQGIDRDATNMAQVAGFPPE